MPRPYRLTARKASADETRARVIAAARELLATSSSPGGFSIDAVARAADVARMTVYYQFGTKAGLLQALFYDLAQQGGMQQLPAAFQKPDPLDGLDEFVAVFCRFWASDRMVFRRLRALAALDPELEQELASREQGAQRGLHVLLERIVAAGGRPQPAALEQTVAVLFTLTSFQTYDTLASRIDGGPDAIAPLLQRLARGAIGLVLATGERSPRRALRVTDT